MTTGPDHNPLIDEQLSAWLDDELPRVELELLVTRLSASHEHQARLARYSLIGSSLRGVPLGTVSNELAALQLAGRIRAALDEPTGAVQQPALLRPKRALLPYAIAAVLALVAVLSTMVQGPLRHPVGAPVQASAQPVMATPQRQASLSSQRLTNYLVYHGEYSGPLSARVTESHIINGRPYSVALQMTDGSVTR